MAEPTVLVVDDEPNIVALVTEVLHAYGYAVTGTSDPERALDLVHTTPTLQLIVSDLMMPRMNGLEMVRRACNLRPELSVLFMTGGYYDLSFRKTDRVLPKPLDIRELTLEVDRMLADGSCRSAVPAAGWTGPERRRQERERAAAAAG